MISAHVPYLRNPGPQPHGEARLHELITGALLPLLTMLEDLRAHGHAPRVALACSPVLLEQLADPVVQKHTTIWLGQQQQQARAMLAAADQSGDNHQRYLASFCLNLAETSLQQFDGRFGRSLIGAIRALAADGTLELLDGPATHPLLPLLGTTPSLLAQAATGRMTALQRLGHTGAGFWLPECGFHPRLSEMLHGIGARYTIVDAESAGEEADLFRPVLLSGTHVAAFARHDALTAHISSFEAGYAGDPLFLSQRRHPEYGARLWRTGLGEEAAYDPYLAFKRVEEYADHFRTLVDTTLRYAPASHSPPVAVVALDADLLGQHWFEGIAWLRHLCEQASTSGWQLTTPGAYLQQHPPRQAATLREGSWLAAIPSGNTVAALRSALQEAEEQVARLVAHHQTVSGAQERMLNQAVRELLLAQSSDWLLLLNQQQGASAAYQRTIAHLRRCDELCGMVERRVVDDATKRRLDELEELDNPFPALNFRVFSG